MAGRKDQIDERAHFLAESADTRPLAPSPPIAKSKPQNANLGHRDRLRQRFAQGGADALADYELLELFLFRSVPRRDTKPLAKALLARFGTLAGVVSAPRERLVEVEGVGASIALDLQIIAAAAKQMAKSQIGDREVLSSWSDVLAYCTASMAHEEREQFRILFLDKKNKLIADEVQQVGTVDHTPVYPREVVKRALELSATAIILLHNHPSGDPTPSRADITMTKSITEIANTLDIVVHDHIIISKTGHSSLRGLGYMG